MPYLPPRPDLEQLRHQAKDLLRAAKAGDPTAVARIRAVSDRRILTSAQLALAREYGFGSWARLKTEVDRREILNGRDLARVTSLLTGDPGLARERMVNWSDHKSANPLAYIAMIGFDHERLGLPSDLSGTGDVARALIDAGAPVDGLPEDAETPLMTAASYGDLEVARVLIDAGADIDARARPDSGGVPGGTALMHAAVFGMTDVLDLLVDAGGQAHGIESAAAIGDISIWLTPDTPLQSRIRALIFAADHQRLNVIDELVKHDTPVDAVDEMFGRQALRLAAQHGRTRSVQQLLSHGADPELRDEHGHTALDLCQPRYRYLDNPGHDEVDAILRPITEPHDPH
jgi:ankyrin repeat protein